MWICVLPSLLRSVSNISIRLICLQLDSISSSTSPSELNDPPEMSPARTAAGALPLYIGRKTEHDENNQLLLQLTVDGSNQQGHAASSAFYLPLLPFSAMKNARPCSLSTGSFRRALIQNAQQIIGYTPIGSRYALVAHRYARIPACNENSAH